MKPSTEDRTEGKLHEVKGRLKNRSERRQTTPIWKIQETRKIMPAKFKNGLAALKKPSENK